MKVLVSWAIARVERCDSDPGFVVLIEVALTTR
jgi:hypothetical protein